MVPPIQDVIRPLTNPFAPAGRHIIILKVISVPLSHPLYSCECAAVIALLFVLWLCIHRDPWQQRVQYSSSVGSSLTNSLLAL